MPDNFNSPRLWNTWYSLYVVFLACLSSFVFFIPTLELIQMPSVQSHTDTRQGHQAPSINKKADRHTIYIADD